MDSIIIVDNGSTDSTSRVMEHAGRQDKRITGCCERRQGYGNACLKGMEYLDSEDIVVFLDADFCEFPGKMYLLLDPLIDDDYSLVLANRHHSGAEKGAFTPAQKWGTKLIVFCIHLLWGFPYKDLGPFRAIKKDKLIMLNMNDKNYGWTMEMQIKALDCHMRVLEVDLPYKRRRAGRSKVSGTLRGVVRAGIKMIFRLFYYKVEHLFHTRRS